MPSKFSSYERNAPESLPLERNDYSQSSIETSTSVASSLDRPKARINLQVGGVLYTVNRSDLKAVSPKYFGIHLEHPYSDPEVSYKKGEGPVWFFVGDGELFKYIKDYAESGRRPLFYDLHDGQFDRVKYSKLVYECQRFRIDALARWIEEEQFLHVVKRKGAHNWEWRGRMDGHGKRLFDRILVRDETIVDEMMLMEKREGREN